MWDRPWSRGRTVSGLASFLVPEPQEQFEISQSSALGLAGSRQDFPASQGTSASQKWQFPAQNSLDSAARTTWAVFPCLVLLRCSHGQDLQKSLPGRTATDAPGSRGGVGNSLDCSQFLGRAGSHRMWVTFPGLPKNEAAGKAGGAEAASFPQPWEGIQAQGLEHPGHQREPQIPAASSGKVSTSTREFRGGFVGFLN